MRMPEWTPEEDAILREHAAKGPKWEGLRELLPKRTYNAICNRRQMLGITTRKHHGHNTKGRLWTPEEDAIIRANALRGPSWSGYKTLLPDRTPVAIKYRREKLGLAFERPGIPYGGSQVKKPARHAEWTPEDDTALLRLALQMTRETGHPIGECAVRLSELMRARKSGD